MARASVCLFFFCGFTILFPAQQFDPPAPLNPPVAPAENPVTPAKAFLGKVLFWDEQLSSTGTVACGTCHLPTAGGSDPRVLDPQNRLVHPGPDGEYGSADDIVGSAGVAAHGDDGSLDTVDYFGFDVQVTSRKTPPTIDAGYPGSLFWDGRASGRFRDPDTNRVLIAAGAALESQVLGPPVNEVEMGFLGRTWDEIEAELTIAKPLALAQKVPVRLATWIGGRSYPDLFEEAFGTREVSAIHIAYAIATYERVLFSDQTPLDNYLRGDETALTEQELRGLAVFDTTACDACHGGEHMSLHGFRFIGVRDQNDDFGRFNESGDTQNLGSFRIPMLRNVELRPPFFHVGAFDTLDEVVDFYFRGGDFDGDNKPLFIRDRPNRPEQDKIDLVAFLKRPLTDPRVRGGLAPFDSVDLYANSNRVPSIEGSGRSGSGGLAPEPIAMEPPLAGTTAFTVGVKGGLGGSGAVLVIDNQDPGVTSTIPAGAAYHVEEITLQGSGAGQGYGSVNVAIAPTASPSQGFYYGRWYVRDPVASGGVAVSKLIRFQALRPASEDWCGLDLDSDGYSDVRDLVSLMNSRGDCPVPCQGDLNASGANDTADFTIAVPRWNACD
ncbi:cytochrome-c peroxidase [Acanthopleuribacter pedis]|uniref:Cytochrome c domain-containing protein n=1 Tax=Acanthopleuribacter pedis TaxID=442870 RepID=A0A8J7QGE8_9BACT|nr:cytochrome c peroxidase [Acanthopleuribacter pedis]MBO1318070.1 hypothetical protein [Acanthopleuribacter pedis]